MRTSYTWAAVVAIGVHLACPETGFAQARADVQAPKGAAVETRIQSRRIDEDLGAPPSPVDEATRDNYIQKLNGVIGKCGVGARKLNEAELAAELAAEGDAVIGPRSDAKATQLALHLVLTELSLPGIAIERLVASLGLRPGALGNLQRLERAATRLAHHWVEASLARGDKMGDPERVKIAYEQRLLAQVVASAAATKSAQARTFISSVMTRAVPGSILDGRGREVLRQW